MGRGKLYEVSGDAHQMLSRCRTKAEWYEAMNTLAVENAPQLDAEDSIRFWASKLHSIGHPIEKFFVGELHAEYDASDDPNVSFIGSASAKAFLAEFEQLGKPFFVELFPHDRPHGVGQAWFYDPLCAFLREACARGNAVLSLWEN